MYIILAVPLAAIAAAIYYINRKVNKAMANQVDLENHLSDISTGVAALATEIKDLKNRPGGVVTQAELDALDARAVKILADIEAAK